jgi:hypothetical protein
MNLQENIQRIKEVMGLNESLPTWIKRRLTLLEECIRSTYEWLEPMAFNSFDEFLHRVIFKASTDFIYEYAGHNLPYDNMCDLRNEINPYIVDIVYSKYIDEIRDYYNKRIGS